MINKNSRPIRVATAEDLPPDSADAPRGFADVLRTVRRRSGDPSFRSMATRTGFSVSTLTRAFRGEKLPRWEVVAELLKLFDVDAGTAAAVQRTWCQAADVLAPISADVDLPPLPEPTDPNTTTTRSRPAVDTGTRHVCTLCGAYVLDQERHTTWHAEYVRRRAF